FNVAQSLLDRVKSIAVLESAALRTRMPLEGGSNGYISLRGQPFHPMSGPHVETNAVSPNNYKAMGIQSLQYRTYTEEHIHTALQAGPIQRPTLPSTVHSTCMWWCTLQGYRWM